MARIEVDLLTDTGNGAVIHLPGRKYPGLVIQGDTLSELVATTNEAVGALVRGDPGEAEAILRNLRGTLNDALTRYEGALRERGLELPY